MNTYSHQKKIRLSNKKITSKTIKNLTSSKWFFLGILITPTSISSSTPEILKPIVEVVYIKPERKRENELHQEEYFNSDITNIPNIDYGQDAIGGDFI